MRVTDRMIRPSLRPFGRVARLLRGFTPGLFRVCASVQRALYAGRRLRGYDTRSCYAGRPDGSRLRLCVCSKKTRTPGAAGLLWLHGGGFAIGMPEQDFGFFRDFLNAENCVIVAPDYRLSTQAPYPAAVEDCYTALEWLAGNAEALGVNPDLLFVGGNSAGGGLTVSVCLAARERGGPKIAYQMPLYPMLDDRGDSPSAQDNNAPVWNARSNDAAWRLYLGDAYGTQAVSPLAAPARERDFRALPPCCTFVGDIEPFHDETAAYVQALRQAGIRVDFREYAGAYHAFDVICPRADVSKSSRRFLLDRFAAAVRAGRDGA